jgi:microcystin-dependent protein
MAAPFIGQVIRVGFTFAPYGWMLCAGQLVPIDQQQALYALIGTTYGGNGTTNFALPDLRGRVPISFGQGQGTSNYVLGQAGGFEQVTLTSGQMGSHNHLVVLASGTANSGTPSTSALLANEGPAGITRVYTYAPYDSAHQTALSPSAVGMSGGGSPHENRQPYLAVQTAIALNGIFPPRS